MHADSTTKPPLYRDLWARIFVSILAAHLVLAMGEPESFSDFVRLPGYLPLLALNSFLVFLIFSCVRSITIFLDGSFPWAIRIRSRMFLQLFFGVGIPVALCLVFASLYFSHYNMTMTDTGYLKLELWLSVLFILSINSYYCLYYFASHRPESKIDVQPVYPAWSLIRGSEIRKAYEDEVALFYVEKGVCFACLMNGERYKVDRSIGTLADELNADNFFRIHRSVIVSRQAINGFRLESSNRLLLRLNVEVDGDFYVSQRSVKNFKQWFDK